MSELLLTTSAVVESAGVKQDESIYGHQEAMPFFVCVNLSLSRILPACSLFGFWADKLSRCWFVVRVKHYTQANMLYVATSQGQGWGAFQGNLENLVAKLCSGSRRELNPCM